MCKYIWNIYYSTRNAQICECYRYLEDTVAYISYIVLHLRHIVGLSGNTCKHVLIWKSQIQALCNIKYVVVQLMNLQYLLLYYRPYTLCNWNMYGTFL